MMEPSRQGLRVPGWGRSHWEVLPPAGYLSWPVASTQTHTGLWPRISPLRDEYRSVWCDPKHLVTASSTHLQVVSHKHLLTSLLQTFSLETNQLQSSWSVKSELCWSRTDWEEVIQWMMHDLTIVAELLIQWLFSQRRVWCVIHPMVPMWRWRAEHLEVPAQVQQEGHSSQHPVSNHLEISWRRSACLNL